ncbi:MAG TPA: tRNA (adenosine(37)-N6)-dimethylallyltransferase MiaA [Rudaea sp.]|jgi:tRNA dimethylallyltransferase|nr:tRNA (adenosine(37)-N6)-dimethylallyltransferase MiaA [Rudaea sp.]
MGPTASGKTALACTLADRFALAVVSVDSALVYRGLDIGSAKPDARTLENYPHRLIDIRDPAQPYSAADFRNDALREISSIVASDRVPLLVGGTGLYFRALLSGLSELPQADPELREQLNEEGVALGWPAMHARLARIDPAAAARIGSTDAQRIQRALEVIEITGKPISELRSGLPKPFGYRVLKIALIPADRTALHARIAERFDAMLAQGFVAEVEQLRGRVDLNPGLPAMRAVGYRQAWQHLDGEFDAAELRNRGIYATRQLAKRQMTWLRSELDARALDPDLDGYIDIAHRAVADFLRRY